MTANELRIGNWFERISTGEQRKAFPIDIVGEYQCEIAGISDYKPIPLTEEWLKKFGFKNSETINKSPSFFFIMVGGSELHINPQNGIVWIERDINVFNNPALIEYVHQLQNLYYALTNKEL